MTVKLPIATTVARNQPRTSSLRSETFLIASYDPNQWIGSFGYVLGLEPRVLAPPLPQSRESAKAARLSKRWNGAHAQLRDAIADQALKTVQNLSDAFFNRWSRRPKVKMVHQLENRFDPGAKYMRAIELASQVLFQPARDGTYPDVASIERLGADLIAFHDAHARSCDARFMPIRSMGNCLLALVRILRDAEL
jgi:hypothetical protein